MREQLIELIKQYVQETNTWKDTFVKGDGQAKAHTYAEVINDLQKIVNDVK